MKKLDTSELIGVNHIWDNLNDRWIYRAECQDGTTYYNYCQGDDYEEFLEDYTEPDYGLTQFLNVELELGRMKSTSLHEVSTMMWVYNNAVISYVLNKE